jgi:hypothetical protein
MISDCSHRKVQDKTHVSRGESAKFDENPSSPITLAKETDVPSKEQLSPLYAMILISIGFDAYNWLSSLYECSLML